MNKPGSVAKRPGERAILPWTFVAGALVHVVVPIYLVAVVLACILRAPRHASPAQLLAIALPFSVRFLLVYAAVTVAASLAARIADPVLRKRRLLRATTDPVARAAATDHMVGSAKVAAGARLGAESADVLDTIDAAPWDRTDPRTPALAADLTRIVEAATRALASAAPERRAAILATTTASLRGVASAFAELAEERSGRDEGEVQTLSSYVRFRYGTFDFSGDADR